MTDVKCDECGYEYAFCDHYYKSGEVYIFCERCGSSYTCERAYDKELTKKIYNKVKSLLKQNKIIEAHKETKTSYISHQKNDKGEWVEIKSDDVDIENKKKDIEYFLRRAKERKYEYFYKYDKDGKPVFNENKQICKRHYTIKHKNGVSSCGGIKHLWKDFWNFKAEMKKLLKKDKEKDIVDITYTFKNKGKWFIKSLITGETKPFISKYEYDEQKEKERQEKEAKELIYYCEKCMCEMEKDKIWESRIVCPKCNDYIDLSGDKLTLKEVKIKKQKKGCKK